MSNAELEKLLQERPYNGGMMFRLASGTETIGFTQAVESSINESEMSASAIISTPSMDRDGDRLNSRGVLLDNYRKNPAVLWNHGFSGISFPIAKCETSDGQLALKVSDATIEAKSYFSKKLMEAEQIFSLIVEKIIRGTSVGFLPKSYRLVPRSEDQLGLDVDLWELTEWSWVSVPANPEAVRKVLDRQHVCGRPLSDSIRKCLLPFAAETRVQGKGMECKCMGNSGPDENGNVLRCGEKKSETGPSGEKELAADSEVENADKDKLSTLSVEKEKVMATDDKNKSAESGKPTAEQLEQAKALIKAAGGLVKMGGEVGTENIDPNKPDSSSPQGPEGEKSNYKLGDTLDQPYGFQLLSSMNAALADLMAKLDVSSTPLENPAVKEFVESFKSSLNEKINELVGCASTNYPTMKMGGGSDEEMSDDEAMQKFLQLGKLHSNGLAGIVIQLKSLAACDKFSKAEKQIVERCHLHLASMAKKAMELKGQPTLKDLEVKHAKELGELKTKYESLEKKSLDLMAKLEEMMPAEVE